MIAQKEITWEIRMMAQKEITWKIQTMGTERLRPLQKKKNGQKGKMATPSPKEKQKKTKNKAKNLSTDIMEKNNQGTHIWRGAEENAKE